MATEPRLEHQVFKVKQLVEDYRGGRIVIPEFQREYVWRRSKAPLLIDSLCRERSISKALPAERVNQERGFAAPPNVLPLELRDHDAAAAVILNELLDLEDLVLKARFCGHLPSFDPSRGDYLTRL